MSRGTAAATTAGDESDSSGGSAVSSASEGGDCDAVVLVPAVYKNLAPGRYTLTVLSACPVTLQRLPRTYACVRVNTSTKSDAAGDTQRHPCTSTAQTLRFKKKRKARRRKAPPKPAPTPKPKPAPKKQKPPRRIKVNHMKDAQRGVASLSDMYANLGI